MYVHSYLLCQDFLHSEVEPYSKPARTNSGQGSRPERSTQRPFLVRTCMLLWGKLVSWFFKSEIIDFLVSIMPTGDPNHIMVVDK